MSFFAGAKGCVVSDGFFLHVGGDMHQHNHRTTTFTTGSHNAYDGGAKSTSAYGWSDDESDYPYPGPYSRHRPQSHLDRGATRGYGPTVDQSGVRASRYGFGPRWKRRRSNPRTHGQPNRPIVTEPEEREQPTEHISDFDAPFDDVNVDELANTGSTSEHQTSQGAAELPDSFAGASSPFAHNESLERARHAFVNMTLDEGTPSARIAEERSFFGVNWRRLVRMH